MILTFTKSLYSWSILVNVEHIHDSLVQLGGCQGGGGLQQDAAWPLPDLGAAYSGGPGHTGLTVIGRSHPGPGLV